MLTKSNTPEINNIADVLNKSHSLPSHETNYAPIRVPVRQ